MLNPKTLQRVLGEIDSRGFSIVENVVDEPTRRQLRAELLTAIEADDVMWAGLPGKTHDLINNLIIHGGAFLQLLDHPLMHQIFSAVLGENCVLYNYGSTFLLPGGKPSSSNIHVDTPRLIPGHPLGLIMTLALDDFTADNGATYYLPGSHRSTEVPTPEHFARHAVSVARPAGAAVFFNPRCFHRAMDNRSNDIRCGLTVYATRVYMKPRFDFPRMVPADALSTLTPKARQFLGFDARVPADMREFYVAEADRLYKAGQG